MEAPGMGNLIAFKVATGRVAMIDDRVPNAKQLEVSRACTLLEAPSMFIYGIRLYSKDQLTGYRTASTEILDKASAQKLGIKKVKRDESKIPEMKQKLKDFSDVTALIAGSPRGLATGQHHFNKFESVVGGKTNEEKFDFIASRIGKEISFQDFFKPGEYIDVASITKGKGWRGVIKRFGVARVSHKATQKIRHVGTLGPFKPGKVLYSVPQAGQTGFNYRIEQNKRILKIGSKIDAGALTPASGFLNYGALKNSYIIVDGSVPGPSKRLVRIRKSITNINAKGGIKEPKINNVMF
jgi:large subunit ribosomal protein L3